MKHPASSLAAFARRPVEHVRLERDHEDRAVLDRVAMSLAPGHELAPALWEALLGSVTLRDRYLLPSV